MYFFNSYDNSKYFSYLYGISYMYLILLYTMIILMLIICHHEHIIVFDVTKELVFFSTDMMNCTGVIDSLSIMILKYNITHTIYIYGK